MTSFSRCVQQHFMCCWPFVDLWIEDPPLPPRKPKSRRRHRHRSIELIREVRPTNMKVRELACSPSLYFTHSSPLSPPHPLSPAHWRSHACANKRLKRQSTLKGSSQHHHCTSSFLPSLHSPPSLYIRPSPSHFPSSPPPNFFNLSSSPSPPTTTRNGIHRLLLRRRRRR